MLFNGEHLVLIDMSWVKYRGLHTFNLSANIDGVEKFTGHIYSVLQTVSSIAKDSRCQVIICQDHFPEWRHKLVPTYKEGRNKDFDVHKDDDAIFALVANLPNVWVAEAEQYEADDVIAELCKRYHENNLIYIHANDDDLLQLASYTNVKFSRALKNGKMEVDPVDVAERKYGIPASKIPIYRTIRGDKSDYLAGIRRFPKQLAVEIAQYLDSFEDFPSKYNRLTADLGVTSARMKYLQKIRQHFTQLRIIYNNFANLLKCDVSELQIYQPSDKGIKEYAERLQLGRKTLRSLKIS